MTVSINGTTGYAGPLGSLTVDSTALQANAVTTAKIADANVTIAKLSATGTPSSSTFLRGDGTWNAPAGGVTSAVAGNGIAVSGATGAVTFSVAAPTAGSVGSYVSAYSTPTGGGNTSVTYNSNYTAGSSQYQIQTASTCYITCPAGLTTVTTNNLSGTWKWLGATVSQNSTYGAHGLAVRVA